MRSASTVANADYGRLCTVHSLHQTRRDYLHLMLSDVERYGRRRKAQQFGSVRGMKALVLERLESDFAGCHVTDRPVPTPGSGEVLVRVESAALNFVDLLMTSGSYQTKPLLPFTLGSDVAGYVEALGENVEGFSVGDAVMGMQLGGAFAQFAVLPANVLRRKPDNWSLSQAAAFGAAYYTAYIALTRRSRIRANQWLLVHGAAGGVGLAAVDLGRALSLRVIAASASADKRQIIAREYQPAAVVDSSAGFCDEIMKITDGEGVAAVLDPVGGDVFDESLRCVAFDGEYLVVGFTSGRIPQAPANIPLLRGFSIVGVRAGEYGRHFPERATQDKQSLWELAQAGAISPRVHAEYGMLDWRNAFEAVAQRRVIGRIVLRPTP